MRSIHPLIASIERRTKSSPRSTQSESAWLVSRSSIASSLNLLISRSAWLDRIRPEIKARRLQRKDGFFRRFRSSARALLVIQSFFSNEQNRKHELLSFPIIPTLRSIGCVPIRCRTKPSHQKRLRIACRERQSKGKPRGERIELQWTLLSFVSTREAFLRKRSAIMNEQCYRLSSI